MTLDITQIIEQYKKDPWEYLTSLPSTSESAQAIIEIWKTQHGDSLIQQLIANGIYIDLDLIISSTSSVEDKLYISNIMFLTRDSGFGNIIKYYKDKYKTDLVTDTFNLNAHATLLGNLIAHFNIIQEQRNWNTAYIIHIAPVIKDIAQYISTIEPEKLAGLMLLHYTLPHIEYMVSEKHEIDDLYDLKNVLNIITTHLYGNRRENVTAIATGLNLQADPNYWKSSLNITPTYNTDENLLPVF